MTRKLGIRKKKQQQLNVGLVSENNNKLFGREAENKISIGHVFDFKSTQKKRKATWASVVHQKKKSFGLLKKRETIRQHQKETEIFSSQIVFWLQEINNEIKTTRW